MSHFISFLGGLALAALLSWAFWPGPESLPDAGPPIISERERTLLDQLDSLQAAMPAAVDVYQAELATAACIQIPMALAGGDRRDAATTPGGQRSNVGQVERPPGEISGAAGAEPSADGDTLAVVPSVTFAPGLAPFNLSLASGRFLVLPTTSSGQPLVEVDAVETRVPAYDQAGRGLLFTYRHPAPRQFLLLTGTALAQPDVLGASAGVTLVRGRVAYSAFYGVSAINTPTGILYRRAPGVSVTLRQVLKRWY